MPKSAATMIRNVVAAVAIAILLVSAPVVDAGKKKTTVSRDNWSEITSGKKVMMFFFWSWCQHCKHFKPTWSALRRKYESDDLIFLEVDCEDIEQDKICNDFDVTAVPYIRWGNTATTFRYTGEQVEEDLEKFIEGTVMKKPICSVLEPENCPLEDRDDIVAIDKLTTEYLEKIIASKHGDPIKMAQQAVRKNGVENPFWMDASGVHQTYGLQSEEELFTSNKASIREQIRLIHEQEANAEEEDDDFVLFKKREEL